jgi:thymidylate kinase
MARDALQIVKVLCNGLDEAGISYCHWKSNEALDRSASGENDLDLLVDRADAEQFAGILHRAGFKEARLPSGRELPGVIDWYGLDPAARRPVHVHAHYQLILGDDMTKNVHLPIERAYLATARPDSLFKVPSAELELVVFVIRMVLKHSAWDAILMFQGNLAASERRELHWLTERADPIDVAGVVTEHLPFLGVALFERCQRAIQPDASLLERVRTARGLTRALAAQSRRRPAVDTILKVSRRARAAFAHKVLGRRVRKRLSAGGCVVGIVGGDGSGKSSAVKELVKLLGRDLDVRSYHLGKPPRAVLSHLVRTVVRAGRLAGLFSNTRLPPSATGPASAASYPGLAWLVWHTLNARDRWRAYGQARRFATNGGIAICDRYPLRHLYLMDGPRAHGLSSTPGLGASARWLSRLERSYYDAILYPDLLIVLTVEPDRAASRRPEQDVDFVRSRNAEVAAFDWRGTPAKVVDANRPAADVLADVCAHVWSAL